MGEPQYRLEGIVHTKSDVLEDFEGPLDVIFELLSKNKIEIQDVSISAILEQYLGYLDEMKRMDMEIASEFITMASHLMLIKTKMLLSAAEQAEAESELDLLRQSLVERKRKEAMEQIRQAVTVLEPRNEIGRCLFTKEPEPLRREQGYRYPHDYPYHYVEQQYMPDALLGTVYYEPAENKNERAIRKYMEDVKKATEQ